MVYSKLIRGVQDNNFEKTHYVLLAVKALTLCVGLFITHESKWPSWLKSRSNILALT